MFALTAEMKKAKPKVMGKFLKEEEAKFHLAAMEASWAASKKGRKTKREGLISRLYYSDGKLAGVIELDPIAPGSYAEKGQPKPKGGVMA